jgi:hypothetical protein
MKMATDWIDRLFEPDEDRYNWLLHKLETRAVMPDEVERKVRLMIDSKDPEEWDEAEEIIDEYTPVTDPRKQWQQFKDNL